MHHINRYGTHLKLWFQKKSFVLNVYIRGEKRSQINDLGSHLKKLKKEKKIKNKQAR